jgi:hypothetical protein
MESLLTLPYIKAYNETRKHGGINSLSLTPSEMLLQRLVTSTIHRKARQQGVIYVGNQNVTCQYKYNI